MCKRDHQHLIGELQAVIDDTQATLKQVEAHGLDASMPEDYAQLLDILDRAIKQQRGHTRSLLEE